jgi:hypothetical protein
LDVTCVADFAGLNHVTMRPSKLVRAAADGDVIEFRFNV